MAKKKVYRLSVYLIDPQRKKVLLRKKGDGANAVYKPLSTKLTTRETPDESLRKLISETTNLDFAFIGHDPSMPLVLDERTLKIYPPLHVQVTRVDENTDFVDFVYLAQTKASPEYRKGDQLYWFNRGNLKKMSTSTGAVARHILDIMKGS